MVITGRATTLQKPEMLDFYPDAPLADKDEKEKESSENITKVHNSEEDVEGLICCTRFTIVIVNDEVDTLNGPENPKDEEESAVEKLEENFNINRNRPPQPQNEINFDCVKPH